METREITPHWIDRYHEQDLDEAEMALFSRQIYSNPVLRLEVNLDADLDKLLTDKDLLDLMAKTQAVTRRSELQVRIINIISVAASILFLALTGSLFYFVPKPAVRSHQSSAVCCSPAYHFTISPFHHFTISPFHHFTISPFRHFTPSMPPFPPQQVPPSVVLQQQRQPGPVD
jgi:hypothetical protein